MQRAQVHDSAEMKVAPVPAAGATISKQTINYLQSRLRDASKSRTLVKVALKATADASHPSQRSSEVACR